MNKNKLKGLANLLAPKDENGQDVHINVSAYRNYIILVLMIMAMGLAYIYNDLDYELQIDHYTESRQQLMDLRYIYLLDQKNLNRAGMRSNVEAKLAERNSRVSASKTKPILIDYEKTN